MFFFDFRTYFLMMRLAFAEKPKGSRRTTLLLLAILIPVFAAVNALCMLLDVVLFPRFLWVEPRRPVFIVGHARSGTTLLHRLMSGDSERFSVFLTWELFFPSIVQKKLVRWLGRMDQRWLSGAVDK
ncbi:MAG TPA: sulfotransferase, partial [Candidatus Binatia bacterium]|nr:sulfotransferase [Candidatus Binatia bacterium]